MKLSLIGGIIMFFVAQIIGFLTFYHLQLNIITAVLAFLFGFYSIKLGIQIEVSIRTFFANRNKKQL